MSLRCWRSVTAWVAGALPGILLGLVSLATAQAPRHPLYRSDLPPGVVGGFQVATKPGRLGYVQPVEVIVPEGAVASIAGDGTFAWDATRLQAGLLVGHPYRLRLTNLPRHADAELYPSIELIDRLHPPEGQRDRFPVQIEITQDDIDAALRGQMVVRVIYVENPLNAFPKSTTEQRSFDVLPSEDPLQVADEQGRPIAILRLGSLVPLNGEYSQEFLFGSPPVEALAMVSRPPTGGSGEHWSVPYSSPDGMSPMPATQSPAPIIEKRPAAPPASIPSDPFVDDPQASLRAPSDTQSRVNATSVVAYVPSSSGDRSEVTPASGLFATSDCPPCVTGSPTGPLPCPSSDANGTVCANCPPSAGPEWPADEYLCDGGDQGTLVGVGKDWQVYGLDPEDTVGHYDTLEGQTIVTPSNSVCIYSPRFAAVRRVTGASEDDLLQLSEAINQPLPPITEEGTANPFLVDQPLPPVRATGLAGPRALRHRTRGQDLVNALPVHELNQDFAVHEDFQIIRLGIHSSSQRTDVERYVDAAIVWSEPVAPEVMLEQTPAEVDVTVEKIGTEYHLGVPGKPRLRVIKLASTDNALPGEEVTFTLRFDNVGEQTIGNVTLLDNLTTRLEYVPNTAECTLKADFFAAENAGESLALRWEIREPIRPGEGGLIRFRCKVR